MKNILLGLQHLESNKFFAQSTRNQLYSTKRQSPRNLVGWAYGDQFELKFKSYHLVVRCIA